jgi:hypothetical protein
MGRDHPQSNIWPQSHGDTEIEDRESKIEDGIYKDCPLPSILRPRFSLWLWWLNLDSTLMLDSAV